ncbi:MAG: tetratricopeptide repeat protein [Promethearchaeota archaeon]
MKYQIAHYVSSAGSPENKRILQIFKDNREKPAKFLDDIADFIRTGDLEDETAFCTAMTILWFGKRFNLLYELGEQYQNQFPSALIFTDDYFNGRVGPDRYIRKVNEIKAHALEIGSPHIYIYTTFLQMNRYRYFGRFEEMLSLYDDMLKFAQREGGDKLVNIAKRGIFLVCWALRNLGQFARGIREGKALVILARRQQDIFAEAVALNALGVSYSPLGRWEESIECFKLMLPILEEIRDYIGKSASLNNTGYVLMFTGRYEEAEKYLLEALEVREKTGAVIHEILHSLGELYLYMGKLDKALENAERAYELLPKEDTIAAFYPALLAHVYIDLGQVDKAVKYVEEVHTGAKSRSSDFEMIQYYHCKGLLEEKRGNLGDAEKAFSDALYLADSLRLTRDCVRSRVSLAKILTDRYRLTENTELLDRALEELQLAEALCNEANLEAMAIEIRLLRGIIDILEERFDIARELLEEGLARSQQGNLPLTKDFKYYLQEVKQRAPTEKVREGIFHRILGGIRRLFHAQAPSRSRSKVKILGCLVISRRHSVPVFSQLEEDRFKLDSVLMSGLITAVEMFTNELSTDVKGSLQSIIHEQIVILLEHDESFVYAILADQDAYIARALAKRIAVMFSDKYEHIVQDPTWNRNLERFAGANDLFTEALTSMQLA